MLNPNVPEILAQVADSRNEVEDAFPALKDLPDGTDPEYGSLVDAATVIASIGAATDNLTFAQLATIGFFAAMSAGNDAELRQALIDFAAFLVAWVEEIDRRSPGKPAEPKAVAA